MAAGSSGEIPDTFFVSQAERSAYIGKSAERFFDDEGFYRTGDGGYVDLGGRLFWEGRITAMIKTGGANVSLEEVDDVIAKFPGVKRTQAVGVPHPTLSEMVVACIVPVDGTTLDEAKIVALLKEQLARFGRRRSSGWGLRFDAE